MRDLRSSFLRPPCGTWSASLVIGRTSANDKNIPIIECFDVFSTVIAFAGIESRFAAARVFPERRRADATLARAPQGTSARKVAQPMFRRQITERRELSLSQGPHGHSDSRPKGALPLDSTASVSGGLQEPPRCGTRKHVCKPAVTQAGQTADPPRVELVDANGFFASLVFRRVRARNCLVSATAPEARLPLTLRSGRPITTAQAGSPDPVQRPLETLLAELACRRLRILAAEEKPS